MNGTNGTNGANGTNGTNGANGQNCTVTKNAATGVTTITCADGTTATVEDGVDGQKGDKGDKGDTGATGAPGAPGLVSLVKMDAEPAGTNCLNGGTRVQSGVDASGNGALEAGEVTQAQYLCNPSGGSGGGAGSTGCTTLEGSYTVTNTLDWQNLVNSGCTALTGALIIDAPGLTTLAPAAPLTSVGSVKVTSNDQLVEFGSNLASLTTVTGRIHIASNTLLTTINFPKLATVKQLDVRSNPVMASLLLPQLVTAGRGDISYNAVLTNLSFPALTSVDGDLWVTSNPALTSVGVPVLAAAKTIRFYQNDLLATLSFPALTSAQGGLNVTSNPAVTSISMAKLGSVGSNVELSSNPVLASLQLPELATVAGYMELSTNPALTGFTLPKVTSVNGRAMPGCRGAFPYHDNGVGTCVLAGCSSGYHDGGDGQCVTNGACSNGFAAGAGGLCFGALVSVTGGTASGNDWSYALVAPATSVTISDFKLDRTEVTVTQYAACVTAGSCTAANTGGACNAQVAGRDYHPINCVDWNQATAFCTWVGKRLPTEAEWQWASSNGGTTTYPWGDGSPVEPLAQWSGNASKTSTAAVGLHPAGSTSGGIQDMAGNVWEWTSSAYSVGSSYKSVRGGSWSYFEDLLRAADRNGNYPDLRCDLIGFRCAQ
jgi:hypothetical protein